MKVGDVIEGRYAVEEVLGEGGMARVFRVRHLGLGSVHALKVLNPELAERVEVRTRFASEGKIQAQIRHPNIVAVTEVVAEPGLYGLVMEYVEGLPMDGFLAGLTAPPEAELVRAFILPVLDAMGLAHRHGVVHRDLKPENILVGRDVHGRPWPRVSDFGIAKVRQEAEDARATRTGTSMGTRGYMSPEQIKSSKDVNARSDIFSLGATLYELATLKQAFPGDSDYEVMDRIVHERFVPPEKVHPAIDPAIARAIAIALRADPEARFATCEEFAAEVRGERRTAEPTDPSLPTPPAIAPQVPGRPDTHPDSPGEVLDLATLEPLPTPPSAREPLSLASFEVEVATPEQAAPLWARVLDWAKDWPEPVRDSLQLIGAERHPVVRMSTRSTFERRELKSRSIQVPVGAASPPEGLPRDHLDPFELRLPPPAKPPGHTETFAVAGTVAVRSCAACRSQGAIACITCGGEGGSKCSACSGTGSIACVLCDGLGTVLDVSGEGRVICPSCGGTNVARCLATGCDGGLLACSECGRAGSRTCQHCSGSGRVAKATVVSRVAQPAEGKAWVEFGLPEMVLESLDSLPEEGIVEVAASLEGTLEGVDFRLLPFLQRAEDRIAQELEADGSTWRATGRQVELRRVEVWRVTYGSLQGEHPVWLIGPGGTVVGETTPVGAWRTALLEQVERLAVAGDAPGLHRIHLQKAFDPEDQRVVELGQRMAAQVRARWDRGEVALARQLRDAAPIPVAPALRAALAQREAALREARADQLRRRLLRWSLVGVGLAAAIAAALELGPR